MGLILFRVALKMIESKYVHRLFFWTLLLSIASGALELIFPFEYLTPMFRIVQGASFGAATAVQALIVSNFSSKRITANRLGVVSVVSTLAFAVSPPVASFLTVDGGMREVLYVTSPLSVLGCTFLIFCIPGTQIEFHVSRMRLPRSFSIILLAMMGTVPFAAIETGAPYAFELGGIHISERTPLFIAYSIFGIGTVSGKIIGTWLARNFNEFIVLRFFCALLLLLCIVYLRKPETAIFLIIGLASLFISVITFMVSAVVTNLTNKYKNTSYLFNNQLFTGLAYAGTAALTSLASPTLSATCVYLTCLATFTAFLVSIVIPHELATPAVADPRRDVG